MKWKYGKTILPILISIIAMLCSGCTVKEKNTAGEFTKAEIQYVVDGDTLVVAIQDREETIRMIGVNTPESVHPEKEQNTEEGKRASEYTKSRLTEGMEVYLEYDKERTDIYGRTLAYVWLTNDCDTTDYEDFKKYNYGAELLQNTYCEAVYYEPNGKYRRWYEKLMKDKEK